MTKPAPAFPPELRIGARRGLRSDNPTDVNTLARLKAFILGGADSRQEVRAMLSLENLQERYARAHGDRRDVTPEMAGVLDSPRTVGETDGCDGTTSSK